MRRTRRTIIGLILGVIAGAVFVMVPGLLAQKSSAGSSNGYNVLGGSANPEIASRQISLYGVSTASPLGLILITTFLIFLAAVAVSLLTRNLTMTKVTQSHSAQTEASTSAASDHS